MTIAHEIVNGRIWQFTGIYWRLPAYFVSAGSSREYDNVKSTVPGDSIDAFHDIVNAFVALTDVELFLGEKTDE